MRDPQDIVNLGDSTVPSRPVRPRGGADGPARFLSVWFRCCHTYGRMSMTPDRTEYVGRCPRCGAAVRARVGSGGTNQRMFEAR